MSNYLATDTELISIADAIRTKLGTSDELSFPNGFTSAINNISDSGISTIQVTVIPDSDPNNTTYHELGLPQVLTSSGYIGNFTINDLDTSTVFQLVKSPSQLYIDLFDEHGIITAVSGEIDSLGHGDYRINGDCTITVERYFIDVV